MEAIKGIEKVKAAADAATGEAKTVTSIEVGQFARQGDIYLHRVADDWPRGKALSNHQLAPGETRGSRHVANSACNIFEGQKLPEYVAEHIKEYHATFAFDGIARAILGPVIVSDGNAVINHPEHGDIKLRCGAGTFQVTYQLDERTKERVQD